MQARNFRRLLSSLPLILLAAACSTADNPYVKFEDPPLVKASLHAVTVASDTDAVAARIAGAGFNEYQLVPNYQRADMVEASIWGVPETVVAKVRHFKATKAGVPDVRLLQMPLAARGRAADGAIDEAFFRNVLGTDVPRWPLPGEPDDNTRVQVWTYLVPSVVDASKRMRENGIPVVFDPVGLTTSYLGTHRTMAIRAPDGTVVQLVETTAQ